jgi:hypothetical protein
MTARDQQATLALEFVGDIRAIQQGPYDAEGRGGRELTKFETEVYESALICLMKYFEMELKPTRIRKRRNQKKPGRAPAHKR